MKKHAKDFGSKEFLLNYVNRRWGLTKTSKVGAVMELVRKCQPKTFEEWESWYFDNALTSTKNPTKITKQVLDELGERLFAKLQEIVIPQLKETMQTLCLEDCIEYVYQLTIHRTYDGFLVEKSIVTTQLSKEFPTINFKETDAHLDHAGDIDYLGEVNGKAFGIQVKPVTARANLGNYDISARMQDSFREFESKYKGKVFIVFSVDGQIANKEVIADISKEIERLKD